ncbi:MAG: hypothetical protein M3Z57_04830 [Candidatus Dormibacteraeota bacterium]|nr:hypothetical protein [Candidatus Dormibacteraeota bacterium]
MLTIDAAGRAVALLLGDEDAATPEGGLSGLRADALDAGAGGLVTLPVVGGTGVADLVDAGVTWLATGHTPLGEDGMFLSLWPSNRNPSASPSRNVCAEKPRFEYVQDPPPRLTYIAQ